MMDDMMDGYCMEHEDNAREKSNWAFPDTLWILLLLTLPTFGESDIARAMLDAGFERLKEVAENAKQSISEIERPAADAE